MSSGGHDSLSVFRKCESLKTHFHPVYLYFRVTRPVSNHRHTQNHSYLYTYIKKNRLFLLQFIRYCRFSLVGGCPSEPPFYTARILHGRLSDSTFLNRFHYVFSALLVRDAPRNFLTIFPITYSKKYFTFRDYRSIVRRPIS